jgi:hypothetical protein
MLNASTKRNALARYIAGLRAEQRRYPPGSPMHASIEHLIAAALAKHSRKRKRNVAENIM